MTGLVVNSLLLWLLVSGAGLGYLLAAALATQGSTTWNFLWIERLAFSAHGSPGALRRYLQFAVMNNTAMLLRLPVLALLTSALGINYLVSNALTLLLLFALRFGLSDRIIWASPVTNATAQEAAIVERFLGRDVASLGLTMLGNEFEGGDLARHVYRCAGVDLPHDLSGSSSLIHGAAEPGDIVVFATGTALHLARGSILDTVGGRVRIRRLDDAELSCLKVLHFEG
jgi:putative flippase GtrA